MLSRTSLGLGLILAIGALIMFSKGEISGAHCYIVGEHGPDSYCFEPAFYKSLWVVALALIGFGLWDAWKKAYWKNGT